MTAETGSARDARATIRSRAAAASSQIGRAPLAASAEAARRQRAAQIGQLTGNGNEVVEARFRNRRRGEQLTRIRVGRVIAASASVGAISTMCPACITAIRSQYSPARPRSWVISSVDIRVAAAHVPDQVHDHRLRCHIEPGGRLVRDQQRRRAGERHGDHHALAHAAGQLERIGFRRGVRDRECGPAPAPRSPPAADRGSAGRVLAAARPRSACRPCGSD